jgi:hypothetical protein
MKKKFDSPYDISEDEVKIEGRPWDSDECQVLWMRHMTQCDQMEEFWSGDKQRGKKCFDYEKGNIYSSKQYSYLEKKEDKYPVQPRLMESRIYALMGEILKGRKSGSITVEGGSLDSPSESAVKVSIANLLMKDMEKRFYERRITKDLLHDGLVSCYPVWVWIEKGLPSQGEGVLKATLLPWDSTAVAPFHFRYPEDITCVEYSDAVKEAELIDKYPEMKSQILAHRVGANTKDSSLLTSIGEFGSISSSDRNRLYSNAVSGINTIGLPDSYYMVKTRVFALCRKELIAINFENPDDFHIRPPEWNDRQWELFMEERRKDGVDYVEDERKVRVLWKTVGTTSGLMLENKKHWYQRNGRMPGAPFWPAMIDGDVSGPGEKMLDKILMAACADTEFLDEVRKGSGSVWLMRSGVVRNIEAFQTEVSRNNGTLFISQDFPGTMEQAISNVQRKPNTSMLEYGMRIRDELDDETRINAAMQGDTKASQAAIAKSMELAQGLMSLAEYVENFNLWWESFQDLKASLISYMYQLPDVIEIMDESTGMPMEVPINQQETDITGEIVGVVNDLSAVEYKFKITPVDDSPSAKEAERQQAMIFLNAVPGPLAQIDPSGELLAHFMSAMPNRILQQVGKRLLAKSQERAQSQQQTAQQMQMMEANERLMKLKNEAEKIKASKANVSLTGEQLAMYPELTQLLNEIGYFNGSQQPVPPEAQAGQQQPPVPQQSPSPSPEVGQMAPVGTV